MFKLRRTTKPKPAIPEGHATDPATVPATPTSPPRDLTPLPNPVFAPGQRVANRYRIERLLGRGGMGEVYEAQDEELAIPVALKLLRSEAGREREALWRLKREVMLARSVVHPHVCRVHDLGRHGDGPGGLWFLTMELLRGESLRERLQRRGRLAPHEALPLVDQMAAGLEAAHRAGVVHRDFKSGNVMLVQDQAGERAVVVDFGLARAPGGLIGEEAERTKSGVVVGTPANMAPEQVRGEEAGPAADIYALGVVLYEMVTGMLPFTGKTPVEMAVKRLVEDAPSPRGVVAELDERWEAVILRCLAREPKARFARAEEVADALSGRAPVVPVRFLGPSQGRHALPAERDVFVGREAELHELEGRLGNGSHLVTLLGAAGMGKTRLAVRYGWRTLESWSGGVWFCNLAEARSRDGIASAVAGALGVPLGKGDPVEQLGHAIAGRERCLVILDNFEQAVEHAGETVERWLERADRARFVVTSRERLNLREEHVQVVESLSPDTGTELFVERARQQRPGLELKELELGSVREVVRLTEGMPLAIELAAARVRVMTVGQVVERMQERFRLLAREGGGRHASLRAAISGSWELLQPWEQAAWAQCAVFEGGFTLEAAEAVLDLSPWPEAPWVVDVVQSLVDKSLLRMWVPEVRGGSAPQVRFGMYVSLQEYAQKKLREAVAPRGESGAPGERAAEERHGKWYARHGTDEAIEALHRHGGVERWWMLQQEIENLVAACRRAVARGDGETAVAMYSAAWEVFKLRGPYGAAVELGQEILKLQLQLEEQGHVLRTLGHAEWRSGRVDEARAHDEAALSIYREVVDRRGEGNVLGNLGVLHVDQGRLEEARAHYEAAIAIHRESGHRRFEGGVLANLGNLHHVQGRMEEARTHYEAAIAIIREMGDRPAEGFVLNNLATVHLDQGRMEEARAHYETALSIYRESGDRRFEGIALGNLGIVHREQGRMEEARIQLEAALAIHREVGERRSEGLVLGNLGELCRVQGRKEEARSHYAAALAIHGELGNRRHEGAVLGHLGNLHLDEGRMEEAREALTRGAGLLREVGDRLELAKLLCIRAELERQIGDTSAARTTLREAEALADKVGAGPDSELGRELAKLRQALVAN